MPSQGTPTAAAGVLVRPDGHRAVLVVDGAHVSLTPRPVAGVEQLLGELVAASSAAGLRSVTVDVSGVLLDAVARTAAELPRAAVVRIVPRPASDPVLARSPADLVEWLISHRFTVPGGHDLLGNELRPLDTDAVARTCRALVAADVRHVAVVAAGSQARPQHERAVADAVQAAVPGARISAASEFGGQGLVAREATVVLDCVLGPPADRLLARWQRALTRLAPDVPLRVARGDGGFSVPSRVRAMPSVTLGATEAAELCGAAYVAGLQDCRVLLPRGTGHLAGDVRHGLPVVRSAQVVGRLGTELVVPTVALTPDAADAAGRPVGRVTDVPVVVATGDRDELAAVGAAVSQPTGWLDEIAYIESAQQLDGVRREAEERATAMVMANGAAPGTTYLVESSSVAVPYSPSGTVRLRVRVDGASEAAAGHRRPAGAAR